MSNTHKVYLSIGSNIRPKTYLPQAVDLLYERVQILAISNAWESHAVGNSGPDFLNACVLIETSLSLEELKEEIVRPVEAALGRVRGADKNSPRTIDIDAIMFDDEAINPENWDNPFVVVPMAEIAPDCIHPHLRIKMSEASTQTRARTWIEKRPGILTPLGS